MNKLMVILSLLLALSPATAKRNTDKEKFLTKYRYAYSTPRGNTLVEPTGAFCEAGICMVIYKLWRGEEGLIMSNAVGAVKGKWFFWTENFNEGSAQNVMNLKPPKKKSAVVNRIEHLDALCTDTEDPHDCVRPYEETRIDLYGAQRILIRR